MQLSSVRKTQVPIYLRPFAARLLCLVAFGFWVYVMIDTPGLTPGVIESVAGIGLGIPGGVLLSTAVRRYVSHLAASTDERPRSRRLPVEFGLRGTLAGWWIATLLSLLWAGGFFALAVLLSFVHNRAPYLHYPIATFNRYATTISAGQSPLAPILSAFLVYTLGLVLGVAIVMIRWYASLPDGSDTEQ